MKGILGPFAAYGVWVLFDNKPFMGDAWVAQLVDRKSVV